MSLIFNVDNAVSRQLVRLETKILCKEKKGFGALWCSEGQIRILFWNQHLKSDAKNNVQQDVLSILLPMEKYITVLFCFSTLIINSLH
jgi:hypothetical protein